VFWGDASRSDRSWVPCGSSTTCHDGWMRRVLVAALVLLSLSSCAGTSSSAEAPSNGSRIASVILHGQQGPVHVAVEEADSPAERQQGLMGRTSLGGNEGMIFLFGDVVGGSVTSEFWMKDTLIPLSVAFWDEDGRIVGIQDMDPCTEDPCPTYGSPKPYVGALEVNGGFFTEHGVTTGDRIELVE
jgi:uncharacterized membrane protein (UPF0127 family)